MFNSLNSSHQFLNKATRIVLAGSSVGGMAALLWSNYVKELTQAPVYAIADAAVYLNAINIVTNRYDFQTNYINTIKMSSVDSDPPIEQCVEDYYDDNFGKWHCLLVEVIAQYLTVPTFIVNSLYDIWSLEEIVGFKCIKGKSLANCSEG